MAFLRGQERLVKKTVGMYLLGQLDALGWFAPQAPYGATGPLTLIDHVPAAHSLLVPNTLGFTSGPIPADEEAELGASTGGLWHTEHVFFCDIYGESIGVAEALASDVRAAFTGRLPGARRAQPLVDYSQTPPAVAAGHYLEFEDVLTEPLDSQQYKRTWQVVKLTAHHYYNATELPTSVNTVVPDTYTTQYAGSY